jgi:hypothetical protein
VWDSESIIDEQSVLEVLQRVRVEKLTLDGRPRSTTAFMVHRMLDRFAPVPGDFQDLKSVASDIAGDRSGLDS